jgi:hypothetical protein
VRNALSWPPFLHQKRVLTRRLIASHLILRPPFPLQSALLLPAGRLSGQATDLTSRTSTHTCSHAHRQQIWLDATSDISTRPYVVLNSSQAHPPDRPRSCNPVRCSLHQCLRCCLDECLRCCLPLLALCSPAAQSLLMHLHPLVLPHHVRVHPAGNLWEPLATSTHARTDGGGRKKERERERERERRERERERKRDLVNRHEDAHAHAHTHSHFTRT